LAAFFLLILFTGFLKMKILILYHSGAGNTRLLSRWICEKLSGKHKVEIAHIHSKYNKEYLQNFDLLVFGFPTHHAAPSLSMTEYIHHLKSFETPAKAFIFTTYGLYPGNSLRIFAKMLNKKNIKVLSYQKFRSPATDGVLLFSSKLRFMFRFEKNITNKLHSFTKEISNAMELTKNLIPPYQWYVPLNDLIKPFGIKYYENLKYQMHIIPALCTNCNLCVNICERKAWKENDPIPLFRRENCEFCLECVHKCPTEAIVFSKKMQKKPRLNKKFYSKAKAELKNK